MTAAVSDADLVALPKAHLHLHLTGGMRRSTLRELAETHGMALPDRLVEPVPTDPAGHPYWLGWPRFQRLYDLARAVLRTPADIERLVLEIAEDERTAGSHWLELQVTPTGYVPRLGDVVTVTELLAGAVDRASRMTGVDVRLVIAANRTRPAWEAELLARLAVRLAPLGIVGFGLSNDERVGAPEEFSKAFRLARDGGLISVPHAGELLGPSSVSRTLAALNPRRLGHGVRAAEDPRLLAQLAARGVAFEVCPASNVALGVASGLADVPLATLTSAGVPVVLAADDPLLFGSGLIDQYVAARDVHGFDRAALAGLAQASIEHSTMPGVHQAEALKSLQNWLDTRDP